MAPKSCEQNLDTCQYLCLVAAVCWLPTSKVSEKVNREDHKFLHSHTPSPFTHSHPPALIFPILPAFVHRQASTSSLLPWVFLCSQTNMHAPLMHPPLFPTHAGTPQSSFTGLPKFPLHCSIPQFVCCLHRVSQGRLHPLCSTHLVLTWGCFCILLNNLKDCLDGIWLNSVNNRNKECQDCHH